MSLVSPGGSIRSSGKSPVWNSSVGSVLVKWSWEVIDVPLSLGYRIVAGVPRGRVAGPATRRRRGARRPRRAAGPRDGPSDAIDQVRGGGFGGRPGEAPRSK